MNERKGRSTQTLNPAKGAGPLDQQQDPLWNCLCQRQQPDDAYVVGASGVHLSSSKLSNGRLPPVAPSMSETIETTKQRKSCHAAALCGPFFDTVMMCFTVANLLLKWSRPEIGVLVPLFKHPEPCDRQGPRHLQIGYRKPLPIVKCFPLRPLPVHVNDRTVYQMMRLAGHLLLRLASAGVR